ncbi:hypothetical protein AAG570_006149 [Ranatra chinensis]|uniref:Chitin-binding type-2 domain-containing protein n=1 Tax=Ranatra chinensis TaxID=642074 RepID=A0ABD0XYY2_9HEMI
MAISRNRLGPTNPEQETTDRLKKNVEAALVERGQAGAEREDCWSLEVERRSGDLTGGDGHFQGYRSVEYLRSLSTFSNVFRCSDAPFEITKICSNETTSEVCFHQQSVYVEFCTGSKPFCVEGECVSEQRGDFNCPTQFGYFPSLTSCNAFYICSKYNPYLYDCLDRSVYDPETKTCVKQSSSKPCHKFNCAGKHLKYASYPGDRTIYALCVKNKPVAIGQCVDNTGMDDSSQKCDIYCKKEGNVEVKGDCRSYHECLLQSGSRYKITRRKCPPNTSFNPGMGVCQPGDCEQQTVV